MTHLILIAAAFAAADTRFADVTESHLPSSPELHSLGSTAVDIDEDGDLDLILAVEFGRNLFYRNDGQGKFENVEGAFADRRHDSEHVEAADFDGDGHLDLIFVAEDDRNHEFYLGRGDGTFTEATDRLPGKSEANGLAVGDLNGDGLPDIFVGNTGSEDRRRGPVSPQNFLWLNDKDNPGHFIDATENLPKLSDQTQSVALADVDEDGDLDVILGNEAPPAGLLINDGQGKFIAAEGFAEGLDMHTRQVFAEDFTGDGHVDLVFFNLTSNAGEYERDPQTIILVGEGSRRYIGETEKNLLPKNTYSTYSGLPVDLDGDGDLDLVSGAVKIPGFSPDRLRALINDGKGNFTDETDAFFPESAVGRNWAIIDGDFNGDGKVDLFIGGWGTQARLLLSQ